MANPATPLDIESPIDADGVWSRQGAIAQFFYWAIHASCLFVLLTGVSTLDLILCFSTFYLRLFGITAGYHRYFAHRSYRTSRAFQLVLALLGVASLQKGPLWWAGGHRRHHQFADQPGDMHSPRDGFWHSHAGWVFCGEWEETQLDRIKDFAPFPELMWLNRWHIVPPILLAIGCFAIGGWSGLVWGFVVSTTLLWHSTYTINSLAHRFGTRRYDTNDGSRNNLWLALLTLGEGWHNNHHRYMASVRQGFFWWEIDLTYYALLGLEKLGIVWDLREPPRKVLEEASKAPIERTA